jgi:hypothetical protein
MPPKHWELAVREHEAILNALLRRDGTGLAHILRTHLRNKRQEVEKAGFAEAEPIRIEKSAARRRKPQAEPIQLNDNAAP